MLIRQLFRHAVGILICLCLTTPVSWATTPKIPESEPAHTRRLQFPDFLFHHYTTGNGLPQETIRAIAEDGDGYIWIGTEGGLTRFDGYRFRNYAFNANDPWSLPDSFVKTLHVDRHGTLWIGTLSGAVARYDREQDRFVRISMYSGEGGSSSVTGMSDDGADGLWIATEKAVSHLDTASGTIRQIVRDGSLPGSGISTVLQDRHGTLWVGGDKGLQRRDRENNRFAAVTLPGPPRMTVFCLHESKDGRLWIGTSAGVYALNAATGIAVPMHGTDAKAPQLNSEAGAIAESPSGEIWVGSYSGEGIFVIDPGTLRIRRVRHDPVQANSLASNDIWALFWDRSGLLWVGTTLGVDLHLPQPGVSTIFGGVGLSNGISAPDVTSVMQSADRHIWLGLNGHGVDILDPASGRITTLPFGAARHGAQESWWVSALTQAPNGDVYIGTAHGLYRADSAGKHLVPVSLPGSSAHEVYSLHVEGGSLWIGTKTDGLLRLELGHGAARVFRPQGAENVSSHKISSIESGPHGSLWVGTGDGLNRYDPASGKVEHLVPTPANQSVPAGQIVSVITDRQGRLWVAPLGGVRGISIMEPRISDRTGHFRHLGVEDGLPNANVDKLLLDQSGNIWVATDDGIANVDATTFMIHSLLRSDGLSISNTWSGAGAVTSNGELLFGGPGGLTVVRPKLLKEWVYRPPIVVTDLRVGGTRVPEGQYYEVNSGRTPNRLTITPGANSLAVEFSALDYSGTELNRYAYWLDGYDKGWIDTDASRRIAAYTNLPPGDYRLHLRGSNRKGVWTERELVLPIRVLPAWYQQWWFRVIQVVALLALILLTNRIWSRRLLRHRALLEEQVKERTAVIVEQKAVIEKKAKDLEVACRTLEELSIVDSLTGLHNRRHLLRNIDADILLCLRRYEHWAKSSDTSLPAETDIIFYMIDLDHFKAVNDTYGHAAGDLVLVQMSERLKEVLRESDYLIRWGGEEFLMVARMTNRDSAELIAERIRTAISSRDFDVGDGAGIHKTCSVGFACFPYLPEHAKLLSWSEVVDIADHALYMAKNGGRNAWVGLYGTEKTPTDNVLQRVTHQTDQTLRVKEACLVSSADLNSF